MDIVPKGWVVRQAWWVVTILFLRGGLRRIGGDRDNVPKRSYFLSLP
jgi:hypothetical protein